MSKFSAWWRQLARSYGKNYRPDDMHRFSARERCELQ
jgi:hypothetical protein